MKLVIFIPAYNESETVGEVIKAIPPHIDKISKIDVFVINDGSEDSTAQKAAEAGAEVVSISSHRGLAAAYKIGLQTALASGADIICHLDADGQYSAKETGLVIGPVLRGEADFVTGDRGVGRLAWMDPVRKYGNMAGSWFLRALTGLRVRDASCGFRAYSRAAAEKLEVFSSHTYTHETLIEAKFKGLRIAQVPISFVTRPRKNHSRLTGNLLGHIFKSFGAILTAKKRYSCTGK
jgi:glycosyltransferase involved in cell wall biosynthesis